MSITRSVLLRASRSQWLARRVARRPFVLRAVSRFMPGEEPESALQASARIAAEGRGTVLTWLGERTSTAEEAGAVHEHYRTMFDTVSEQALPTHISVKPSHLGLDVAPDACTAAITDLALRAEATQSFLWIDMEESWYVDSTLDLYRAARAHTQRVGVCMQAYLRRTPQDVDALMEFSASQDGGGVAIRLVKGAYREDPALVYTSRPEIDAAFVRIAEHLLSSAAAPGSLPVMGTHDMAIIEQVRSAARRLALAKDAWELHMLYGIRVNDQRDLAGDDVVVRTLISYGRAWFPWYMRRLAERPANMLFVVRSLVPGL
jgi:proline dehydrogenase